MSITEPRLETVEIVVSPELARQLADAEAAGKRPILIRDGSRYQLNRIEPGTPAPVKPDLWADYDPQRLHNAIEKVAGIITPEEAEEAIANIYRWREEGSRPWDREG